jgi:hypothetical protein
MEGHNEKLPVCLSVCHIHEIRFNKISKQNLLSSRLISKNLKIKIYLLFCMGVQLGRSQLREERRLRLFENIVEENIWA